MGVEPAADARDLVRVEGLSKTYLRRGPLGRRHPVRALADVDLRIAPGASVAVVGGSGAGKSTLARCLARLEEPSAGRIWFEDRDLLAACGRELVLLRRRIQLIFQDTGWALDPRHTALEIVGEPWRVAGAADRRERHRRAGELMAQVGLSPVLAGRRPLDMSGGQRQRLAIARALAADPKLLVLDEALSGLDLTIQAQIVSLMRNVQAERRLTCLWISHDLPLMARVAGELLVMHEGRIVERGSPGAILAGPTHPHTRALVSASGVSGPPDASRPAGSPAPAPPETRPPSAPPRASWALAYLGRRALHSAFLIVGVSLLSFVLLELAPGDFFDEMRLNPQISPASLDALRAEHGLDRPLPERYLRWVGSTLRGDMGYSFAYGTPVAPLLWDRARNTIALTTTAALGSWLIAIPLGVWWATRRGRRGDGLMAGATSTLLAVPDVVLALGLLLLALRTGAFPTGGMVSLGFGELDAWGKARDLASHLVLPLVALVAGALPVLLRHVRAGMVEVLASPFVRAARGHGIPRRRLLFRHALPAAAGPLVSLFGLSVATLLSGSLLVEVVMSWPGLGPLLLEAILARDLHLVIGPVMVSTVLLVAWNFLADALLYVTDPRIRAE